MNKDKNIGGNVVILYRVAAEEGKSRSCYIELRNSTPWTLLVTEKKREREREIDRQREVTGDA